MIDKVAIPNSLEHDLVELCRGSKSPRPPKKERKIDRPRAGSNCHSLD